jgi:CO/xanthine dehydrogenase FAD-binding subunit
MMRWKEYHTPRTLEAALQVLKESPESAIIAGGTDLLLDLDQGRHAGVDCLVDVTRIEELHRLEASEGCLVIGAAIPLADILEDPLVGEHAPGLVEACALIGGPQVRNVATLGGNVAHALPAGDGTIALLALNAEACLVSEAAERWVPFPHLFTGPGRVSFDRGKEILKALRFRLRQTGEGSAFRRVMRPQGVAIAILNMGVWTRCDSEGKIKEARIALGPGGPTPFLSQSGSTVLAGRHPDESVLEEAVSAVLREAQFRTSPHRSTQAYREHLIPYLLKETVWGAYERARHYSPSKGSSC